MVKCECLELIVNGRGRTDGIWSKEGKQDLPGSACSSKLLLLLTATAEELTFGHREWTLVALLFAEVPSWGLVSSGWSGETYIASTMAKQRTSISRAVNWTFFTLQRALYKCKKKKKSEMWSCWNGDMSKRTVLWVVQPSQGVRTNIQTSMRDQSELLSPCGDEM